jgi:hypothetical protein
MPERLPALCPKCGKKAMPAWSPDPQTAETARACSDCGHLEEKVQNADR